MRQPAGQSLPRPRCRCWSSTGPRPARRPPLCDSPRWGGGPRLFYVGITRARQHLAISHAWSRTTWGRTQPAMPSRFVTEVPSHLVEDVGLGSPRRGSGYDPLAGDDHLRGAAFSPAIPLETAARNRVPRGSSGAADLGLSGGG